MLRLHVVHLLDESVLHTATSEDGISKSTLTRVGDRLMIDHILNRQLFKKLLCALLLWSRFQVCLLVVFLLTLEQ